MSKKLFLEDKIGFVEILEIFGDDLTVVNAARVSFHKESSEITEKDEGLITYLAKNDHVTPFFHPMLRFRIKMPIFVVREWYRHVVGFARNEVSRRYITDKPDFFVPKVLRKKNPDIKQGSSKEPVNNNENLVKEMHDYVEKALEYYYELLEKKDVCPEQARMILPQSMYTEFIETASLSAYARLVKLRLDKAAQKEIRKYASLIAELIKPKFPVSWKALV
jgi:thymidylate synthase (FAD)